MSTAPPVAAGRGRLPVQTRDHRAALTALALLLVVVGALGAALVVYRTGQRVDVLVASHEIKPGQRVEAADFTTTRVSADADHVVPSSNRGSFLGAYATTDIPAGTLVNPLMFQVGTVIPGDGVLVGVSLAQTQRPASAISAGDVVRAYLLPKSASSSGAVAPGPVLIDAARVVSVASSASSGSSITISLLVDATSAQQLVTAAAQGAVAVAELPSSTKPTIDFQKTR